LEKPQAAASDRDSGATETLEGTIERVTFHSEESRFTVLRLRTERPAPGQQPTSALFAPIVTAVGPSPRPSEGLAVRLIGRWGQHKDHGPQFEFSALEVRPPTDGAGLVKYLSSSTFQGIGETLAKRIVEQLGPDALERIRDEEGALEGIRGLSAAVAEQLRETVRAETGSHELHAFLLGLGLGPWQVQAVIERYGASAEAKLRADPYLLSIGVEGIGFRTADQVAQKLGLSPDGLERRRAGLLHVLRKQVSDGDSFVPVEELFAKVREVLERPFPDEALVEALEGLRRMREIALDEHESEGTTHASVEKIPLLRAWTTLTYACEVGLAERLGALLGATRPEPWAKPEDVARVEARLMLHLDERQRDAVLGLLSHPVGVLTGGPGVGKTTVMRLVVELAHARGARLALASPTGRAAKRLAEATGHEASTVHRLLGYDPDKGGFAHDAERPLDVDMLIVDEVSMLDLALAYSLVKAVKAPTRLVWIGDPNQLPSVAAGNVLADLLASHRVPTWRLTKIFRQSATSRIVTNAHRVLEGQRPELPPKDERSDFYFFPVEGEQATAERLVEVVTERIPRTFGHDWLEDVQVLCPMYRGACGVDELNERLRALIPGRPKSATIRGRTWRKGDRVIHTRNDYERDVFNGDMGQVSSVDHDERGLVVSFPERALHYDAKQLSDLQPAFAITVHRSQGGEYPAVVIPMVTQHYVMLQRHLFYTAITRAKKLCVLVGQQRAIDIAIENDRGNQRTSALAERLGRAREEL
jgi:exodeoxyribonuclease V alpha subunit